MDTYMLCLANSYKHGGRCIAGIQLALLPDMRTRIIKDMNHAPIWIRPISHSLAGEIPNYIALDIPFCSLVKIEGCERAGLDSHTEDVYFKRISVVKRYRGIPNNVLDILSRNNHHLIFGNRGKALTPEDYQRGNYSIMMIKAINAQIYIDHRFEKPRERVSFTYNENIYDFPITDPDFLDKLKYNSTYNRTYDVLYLVVSLAVEHDGWHSKLAATVIIPENSGEQEKQVSQTPAAKPAPKDDSHIRYCKTELIGVPPCAEEDDSSEETDEDDDMSNYRVRDLDEDLAAQVRNYINSTRSKENDKAEEPIENNTPDNSYTPQQEREYELTKKLDELDEKASSLNMKSPYLSESVLSAMEKDKKLRDEILKPKKKEGCYIATMVYGDYDAPEVLVLRKFRDNTLLNLWYGRIFVKFYYWSSPKLVKVLKNKKRINKYIKRLLDRFVERLKRK